MTGYIKKYMKKWLFLMAIVFLLTGCQKKLGLEEYLDLGDKYLTEADYKEAIIAFTKAIEIEPKAMKAYEGLANAYIKTEDYKNAQETISRGISVYEGLSEAEQTEEYKQYYEALLKLQREVESYLNVKNNSEEETEAAETVPQKDFSQYQDVIDDIFAKMESGDREAIWQRQSEDDYQSFITKLDRILTKDCGNGNWFLIYPCGHCYYGEMKDGKRSGYGIWCAYDYKEGLMEYASCTWQDDDPNGDGEVWSVCIPIPEDLFYYQVNLKDGLYQGTVRENYVNETVPAISYECSDGIPAEVQDLHPEERHREDWYCYYSDEYGSSYTARGNKKGILHAGKGWDKEDSMKNHTEEEIQSAKESIEKEKQEWKNITDGIGIEESGEYEFGM